MLVGGLSCTLLWMKPRNRRPGWVIKKLFSWRSSPTVHDCGRPVCWGITTWVTLYAPSSNFPARTAPISFPSSVVLAAEDLKSSEMLLVINILVLSQLLGCPSSTFKVLGIFWIWFRLCLHEDLLVIIWQGTGATGFWFNCDVLFLHAGKAWFPFSSEYNIG